MSKPPVNLEESRISGEEVYSGSLLHVQRDVVRLPDGSEGVREYIRHPGAVAILALFDDGQVLLERQYRYPHRRVFIEIPAGKCDPGEDRLSTAKRELLEETGYVAEDWRHIGVIHPAIAYTDEAIELYVARKLTLREKRLDAGEFLETFTVPLERAVAMVQSGEITDSKTVSGLLLAARFSAA